MPLPSTLMLSEHKQPQCSNVVRIYYFSNLDVTILELLKCITFINLWIELLSHYLFLLQLSGRYCTIVKQQVSEINIYLPWRFMHMYTRPCNRMKFYLNDKSTSKADKNQKNDHCLGLKWTFHRSPLRLDL